jgi:phosphatidylcholine synthase
VHVFTALGAVLAFEALAEAATHRWEAAFLWLGAALAVDAADGPMARRIQVWEKLPRFSGARLDLIVDYLTYVFVPAYIIYEAGLLPAELSAAGAAIILLSSLYHFSDEHSKTEDGFFVGFPAIWNVVALYLFIFPVPAAAAFAVLLGLGLLTFAPVKWVHPLRSRLWRPVTIGILTAWCLAAIAAVLEGFPGSPFTRAVIALASVYIVGIGAIRSLGLQRGSAAPPESNAVSDAEP